MLWVILTLTLAGRHVTSPFLILLVNPSSCIAVRVVRLCLRGRKYFYLIRRLLSVIFSLQCVQEFTPFFVGKGVIVLIFILHLILHGCRYAVLGCNANIILIESFAADGLICLFILGPLLQMWRYTISNIVLLTDALIILENAHPEVLHNIIVHIFNMVLKYGPVITPHALYKLKPQLIIKLGATIRSADGLPIRVTPV